MKRTLLSFLVLIAASVALMAQPVQRDKVVIEIGTATW